MVVNGAVENALATIGAVLWCVQILPQIWKSWRAKSTTGLSPWLMFTWMISLWVLGIYNITQKLSIPLHIQPELCACCFLSCAIQVGCVYALRTGIKNGVTWPIKMFGIIATVLLGGALFPQIWEIIKRKEVVGLSIKFIIIDMLGGAFSFAPPPLDAFAASSYLIVVGMELLILLLATILNPIAYYRRRDEKVTEVIEEIETIDKIVSSKDYVANAEANINRPTDLDDAFAEWF
ncbi:unnamed protein product [Adineta steineri]|uniref:Uncharacterized protein n=1 Tax=Adineta steineri TaxID=433720 RepID=A0A818NBH1_9BILA|nr:unnamed protein product [Adineta steineri]